MVAISPIWTEDYLRKNPPTIIPTFPNYEKKKDGTLRTIIHIKNGNGVWYGRPDWAGSWLYVFREYQDATYLVKQAANNFTGQHFIEIEEDDVESDDLLSGEDAQKSGYADVMDRIEDNFTAKGEDPQTIMMTLRPYGAKQAFVYSFPSNTKENFYKITDEIARRKILENNQWSERLLGNAVGNGFSTDVFVSELKTKDVGLLQDYRQIVNKGPNIALKEIAKFMGISNYEGLGIRNKTTAEKFEGTISNIEDLKRQLDAYGVGARAGIITPVAQDEEYFREILKILPPDEHVNRSWDDFNGYKTPVTLKVDEGALEPNQPIEDPVVKEEQEEV
jgi:hypothetical protein